MKRLIVVIAVLLFASVAEAQVRMLLVTQTVVSVSNATSTLVLAANNQRAFVELTNVGANLISCKVVATAVLNEGISIPANQTRRFTRTDGVPYGAINCIAATAATNLSVAEGTM